MRHLMFDLALAVVVSIPTPAAAMPRTGRRITGVVQKTNWQAREVAIMRTDTSEPLSFVWIDRTIFVANRQLVNAAVLEPGNKVAVIYHQPFFGRPYVTKVTVNSSTAERPQSKQNPLRPVSERRPR